MMRLAAWTPTDAASVTLPPHSTSVTPQDTFDPLKTTSVWAKTQMRKFPSFMNRRKKKKDLVCSEGLCQEAELFSFLNRW